MYAMVHWTEPMREINVVVVGQGSSTRFLHLYMITCILCVGILGNVFFLSKSLEADFLGVLQSCLTMRTWGQNKTTCGPNPVGEPCSKVKLNEYTVKIRSMVNTGLGYLISCSMRTS